MITTLLGAAALVACMELCDKTQVAVAALSASTRNPFSILLAAIAGFLAVNAPVALLGALLHAALPMDTVRTLAALAFIVAGALLLIERRESEESSAKRGVASAFTTVALAELGDKTQLAVLALALTIGPVNALAAAVLGYVIVNAPTALLCSKASSLVELRKVKLASAAVMIAVGIAALLGAW